MNTLVLGLGNILLQDEGIGVRVIERLQQAYEFPAEVLVLDGGTLGLDLLHYLEDTDRAVIVDAVHAHQEPGSRVRLVNEEIPAFLGTKMSPHQVGLQDLLGLARLRGHFPSEVVLLGVQFEKIGPGLDFSDVVGAQLEPLVAQTLAELARWGIPVKRK